MSIVFNFDGRSVAVEPDSDRTVLELARTAGWHIEAQCGGHGSCGSCNVLLGAGRYRVFGEELEIAPEMRREVLACQARILGDAAEIFIPRACVLSFEGARIADEMDIPEHTFYPLFPNGYGLAVDIGTTTVVAALIDLTDGRIVSRASLYNQQILKADNIISRISLCSQPGSLDALQDLVIAHTLNPLIHKLCTETGISKNEIIHCAVSGNTVMMHIFFGVSPVSIGVIPFKPVSRTFAALAHALHIDIEADARVEAVPAISGYVGGDITSDIRASNLWNRDGLTVLIDIGTNGEMVVCIDGQMSACATAAGPAFEGAGLLHGARAASRAIDTIEFDENLDFELTVIGDPVPMGLCGSAIIDFIAWGFRCGLINSMGRYDVAMLKEKGCHETVSGMHACVLVQAAESATGETITVTEYDIAEILKAKAAIYAGLKTLLAELGKTVRDIDHLILAGGFAKHINLGNAICIGLLPDIEIDKYEVIGNGSLAGAALTLLDRSTRQTYLEIIERPRIVTLNKTAHFTDYFEEALALPNLDESDFPSFAKP
jgi:uncharacterized 2Fe-2S/4Fe-4S cluster protein (DUF4445 family)